MQEINVDYNTLSAARKVKAEYVRVVISNHPDFPNGQKWVIEMPKAIYDLIVS